MSDPRNVAHDKKVNQEKKHQAPKTDTANDSPDTASDSPDAAAQPPAPPSATLEASLVVLAQLKDLDFHSRAHLERLAALQMTVEDELKQNDIAGPMAEVYAAQSTFQTRLTTLIDLYKVECDRMLGAAA